MRRFIGTGLCLALGLAVTHARADDPWRPTRRDAAPAAAPRGPALLRPVPLETGGGQPPLTRVSFTPTSEPRPLVRAKPFDPPQPMPAGPPMPISIGNGKDAPQAKGGNNGTKGEMIAPPKGAGMPAVPADVWGQVVSRWDGALPAGDADGCDGPVPCDGVPCADGCPCPGGPCRPLLGRIKHRLFGDCCGALGGDPWCDDGCGRHCLYGRAEYLMWWIKNPSSPELVTTSPPGTARENAGVLGVPSTLALVGGNELDYSVFSGGRFTLGFCLPNHPGCSFETTYFFLGSRQADFINGSNGTPILARPIVNAQTGAQESQLVAFPGVVVGTVAVRSETNLWGIEGNFRKQLCCGCRGHLDLLFGFRYLDLNESLGVTEDLTTLAADGRSGAGTRIIVRDNFGTRNHFYGGQLGLEGEYRLGRWILGGTAKVALGVMHQVVTVNGTTQFIVPGAGSTLESGGLLALPTNIGQYQSNQFAVVPEFGVKLGYQLTDCLRLYAGYNFLYASNVVRPADQIDRVVNKTQLPTAFGPSPLQGPARPMVVFRSTDFWAHGVNFGVELKY